MPELLSQPNLDLLTIKPEATEVSPLEYSAPLPVSITDGPATVVASEPATVASFDCQPQPERPHNRNRFFRFHLGRLALAGLTGLGLAAGSSAIDTAPADAANNKTYTVTDNVWLHSDPGLGDKGDLIKVLPKGAKVQVDCLVQDTPIDGNPVWLHAKTPAGNVGYFTDRYSSSKWSRNNTLVDQGVPVCTSTGNPPRQDDHKGETPKSIFYSSLNPSTGLRDVKTVADINKSLGDWAGGDCSASKVTTSIPASVDTLATWSVGRLAPVYFLEKANKKQKDQIDNIILLDPGATSDMARDRFGELRGRKTCDWRHDPSKTLAQWLKSDKTNRLTIVTGRDTEMKEDPKNIKSHSTFAGLWEFYLADSWNQPFADRVTICDYEGMGHEEVMRKFASTITKRQMGCMAVNGYKLTKWHP